jgi:GMP synthase (glutamine-hydrolysing)
MSESSASPRILVVENEPAAGIGNFGDWLQEAGLVLEICRPHARSPVPAATGADGLIVLGGPMGARDDDRAPWLPATRGLLRRAAEARTPTLGICLGAQLLALGCGGQVEPGAHGCHIGPVWETIDVPDDPLLSGLPSPAPFVHWHCDVITRLPEGAAVLAHTRAYPHQAFRLGRRAWGVQFHPEATIANLTAWAELTGLGADDAQAVMRRTRGRQDEITAASRTIAANFARIVRASSVGVNAERGAG